MTETPNLYARTRADRKSVRLHLGYVGSGRLSRRSPMHLLSCTAGDEPRFLLWIREGCAHPQVLL